MTLPTPIRVPSTDGVVVVAHDHGGDGPPVVFCHATGFHGRYWDPICTRLRDRWHCIALDLRGHGDSVIPPNLDMAWGGMAADVLAVLDALGLGQVHAVGHSMGGCAILLAELARPGSVGNAWLFEPIVPSGDQGWSPSGSEDNPLAASARHRREVFASREEAFDRYASRPPFATAQPEALRAYVDFGFADQEDGSVILKCRGEIEAQVFEHSFTDSFGRLGEIASLVTVAGSGDGAPPAETAPLVAAAIARGRFEAWPDRTHFAPMEDPAAVAVAIDAALCRA